MGIPMAAFYDESIILTGVERLYARANTRIATYSLLGVGIGLSIGYIIAGLLGDCLHFFNHLLTIGVGKSAAFVQNRLGP